MLKIIQQTMKADIDAAFGAFWKYEIYKKSSLIKKIQPCGHKGAGYCI
jgi:hypothetical protein